MATLSKTLTDNTQNASADSDLDYENTIYIGSNSARPNSRSVVRFTGMTIERYAQVGAADLNLYLASPATTGTAPNVRVRLALGANPSMPGTASALRGLTKTSASTVRTIALNAAEGYYTFDFRAALQEIVNLAGWSSGNAIVITLDADPEDGRVVRFRDVGWAANPPAISVTYTNPVAVTGEATATMPSPAASAEGEVGTGGVTGDLTATFASPPADAGGFIGFPPAVTGQAVATFSSPQGELEGVLPDPSVNHPFAVAAPLWNSHHLVTEAGELFGFVTSFDETIGGVRDGVIGSRDDAWTAASGLLNRIPAALNFTAALIDRDDARFDGDELAVALKEALEVHLPNGQVIDVSGAQLRARPSAHALDIVAIPKGANSRHPLLSGLVNAAFKTVGSRPNLPIYAIDPAGGITAPVSYRVAPQGSFCFGVRLTERGVNPLVSLGRPIDAQGTSAADAVTLSYQQKMLVLSLYGMTSHVRESLLGPFGAVLVVHLSFRPGIAHLVTKSDAGAFHFDLPVGEAQELGEQLLTAGVRDDGVGSGAFMALGSPSFAPFFSLRVPDSQEAEEAAHKLYTRLTAPKLSWEVATPDISLELGRNDTKPLELAPGETLALSFAVTRLGNYTGLLTTSVSIGTGLEASVAAAGVDASGRNLYTVTVTAPGGAPEGAYALHLEVKAAGADNEGSLLVGVRDFFDTTLEVAASPVIAPSATYVRYAHDPTLKRPAEILKDSSANGNTFSWSDYARPNRLGTGILATGYGNAAVYSGALANASQPQRMNAEATHCAVLAEVSLIKVGGVIFQLVAEGGDNGVNILRKQGGFGLATVNGGATVESPDTLPYTSGYARLITFVTLTDIILQNRDTGQSIRMARPAWADAAVRTTLGALRAAGGSFSSVTRVHLMADTLHPYALSPIQARRNIDALLPYCPAGDGKPEWPESANLIATFDEATNQLRNTAAPDIGVELAAVGAVSYPTGAVSTPGNTTAYVTTGPEYALAGILSVVSTVENLKDGEPFNAAFSVASSGVAGAAVEVGSDNGGKPLLRHQNGGGAGGDATWNQRSLPNTPVSVLHTLLLEVSNSGKNSVLTSLDTSQTVSRTGVAMSGLLNVTLGAVLRSTGGVVEGQKSKHTALVICRGTLTAQQRKDVRTLMRG